MTTTRLERLTREAFGASKSAGASTDINASFLAPPILIITVTAVLLLSGCAANPVQHYPPEVGALNLGEATSWFTEMPAAGSTVSAAYGSEGE